MKKIYNFAAVVAAAVTLASCGVVDLVKDYAKVAQEAAEIAEGKMFTVETGTVTYDDGMVLTFKNYGRNWASIDIEPDGSKSGIIVTDRYMYQVSFGEGVYTKMAVEEYGFAGCPFIFWETLYEFGDDINPAAVSKGTEKIAGKTCKVFEVDGEVMGGWSRILFLTDEFKAVSWSDKCNEALFSVDGLKEVQMEY